MSCLNKSPKSVILKDPKLPHIDTYLLNQIKNLTFVVYDNDALDQLYESLSPDLKDFSRHVFVEDNVVVKKPCVIRNRTKKFPPLPKPKEKKSALSGRVGVSTEKRKVASVIDVAGK